MRLEGKSTTNCCVGPELKQKHLTHFFIAWVSQIWRLILTTNAVGLYEGFACRHCWLEVLPVCFGVTPAYASSTWWRRYPWKDRVVLLNFSGWWTHHKRGLGIQLQSSPSHLLRLPHSRRQPFHPDQRLPLDLSGMLLCMNTGFIHRVHSLRRVWGWTEDDDPNNDDPLFQNLCWAANCVASNPREQGSPGFSSEEIWMNSNVGGMDWIRERRSETNVCHRADRPWSMKGRLLNLSTAQMSSMRAFIFIVTLGLSLQVWHRCGLLRVRDEDDRMTTFSTTITGALRPIEPKCFETSLCKARFVMFETYSLLLVYKKWSFRGCLVSPRVLIWWVLSLT